MSAAPTATEILEAAGGRYGARNVLSVDDVERAAGELSSERPDASRRHHAAYLMAVGGAAYLVSKAIRTSRVVAFPDLGMEAIYEFEVVDMPVTVAVDANGESVHNTGPREWQQRIGKIPVSVA